MEDDASLLEVAASVTAAGTVFREYQPSSLHPAARSHWKKPGCCFLPAEIGIFIKMASKAELWLVTSGLVVEEKLGVISYASMDLLD